MESGQKVRFAMLNGMAGKDIEGSMRQQAAWGVRDLDLKDGIFGKRVEDLEPAEARRVAALAEELSQRVYCLSSVLFGGTVEEILEPRYESVVTASVGRLIETARILRPRFVRLVTPTSNEVGIYREALRVRGSRIEPMMALYRGAVDAITSAGFEVAIENEAFNCLLGSPEDVQRFFDVLGRPGKAVYTWDVQNLWEGGTFPSLEVYRRLKPLIGFYHVKGGRTGEDGRTLAWKSVLDEASWPVLEITRQVVADGVSPVICINPSHGKLHPDHSMADYARRDLEYLRRHFG